MDRQLVKKLIEDLAKIEEDGVDLFKQAPLEPGERIHTDKGDVIVLHWYPDERQRAISRDLRRRYEAWYHAALRLIKEYIPYQADELESVYDVMISYVTLNRYANTTDEVLAEIKKLYERGYVDIYLEEFANLMDNQASLLRSIEYLPEDEKPSFRCFLTGFPCPTPLHENPNLVFVLMPFSQDFDLVYQLGIKEAVKAVGLQCKRADEIIHTRNVICTAVCQPVRAARYIIADITGKNPNVYYELGMTHGRSEDQDQAHKQVIIITQNIEDIPFDLRNMNIIQYSSPEILRERLRRTLTGLLESEKKA